ncbi:MULTISPECIES: ProQ/FINO family protein [unclassified Acidovorax]|uniref:ProQ/FINO family protein n=1 Tax=unclassified Acidovorax TaxID=2684926 RepID=UPI0006F99113|nr:MULTISPECIES: ProQ/FINO family protein [unclassified Acidovorax]KQW32761.1 proq activator of osmoprotectant transporter prop [Acidovorax sp. Root402]
MTDSVSAQEQPQTAPVAPVAPAAPQAAPVPTEAAAVAVAASEPAALAEAGAPQRRQDGSRRGGRNRRKPEGRQAPQGRASADGAADAAAPAGGPGAGTRAPQRVHPALEQLAGLYPHLFGAVFRPLKRGIFQDILAAHPELFEREALKVALGLHTRSTRYLQSVAAGDKRHDLQGQPVEDMAPEHVHHALLEVYRRKKARATEDLLPKLRNRMMAAFEASGLTREAYTQLVLSRDEAANAILEEAFAEWSARNAKDEALLRAFEASGQTLDAFADMYGMVPRTVGQQLERARRRAAAAASAAAAVSAAPAAEPGDSAAAA